LSTSSCRMHWSPKMITCTQRHAHRDIIPQVSTQAHRTPSQATFAPVQPPSRMPSPPYTRLSWNIHAVFFDFPPRMCACLGVRGSQSWPWSAPSCRGHTPPR
jgi:hypothetical protein